MESKTIVPAARAHGDFVVPGDKSTSHCAVILGALSNRVCTVDNFLSAEDCLCTVEAFRSFGIEIDRQENHLQIRGKGLDGLRPSAKPVWCGNSGTTTRLLMGVLTGQPFDVRLEGDPSLSLPRSRRPRRRRRSSASLVRKRSRIRRGCGFLFAALCSFGETARTPHRCSRHRDNRFRAAHAPCH
jgi:3-phosphoshikimate 1-carboxyvinyltransferase